jgi:hypothetical protein
MLIATLVPEVRSEVRGTIIKDFRTVLSTAEGDLTGAGTPYTVIKVRTQEGLSLEIYAPGENDIPTLVEQIVLADKKDGYFNFSNQTANLAIDDIDGDGRAEILAPTFDDNLVGRLNVYKYDGGLNGFQRIIR